MLVRRFGTGCIPAGFVFAAVIVCAPPAAFAGGHVFSTGPSAFCHVTDGQFTDCDPGGGREEWSDISFLAGVGTSAGAIVYTDQSVAPPRLLLMYDLTGHTQPLAIDSFFDITFHVVEDGQLEVYTVQCFGDGTFRVFEDGTDITDEADTVDCAVGFDGNNVQVELEIDTLVTYSPDIPLFWSTHAPPPGERPPCPPEDPRCECPPEDPACVPALANNLNGQVQTSSAIIIAGSDGITHVLGLPINGPVSDDLCKRNDNGLLVSLMRLLAGRTHGQFVMMVSHAARMALESLAGFGLVSENQIGRIHGCVVSALAKKR